MSNNTQWVYGIHTCQTLLNKHPQRIIQATYLASRADKKLQAIIEQLQQLGIQCSTQTRDEMSTQLSTEQHQGIAFECKAAQLHDKSFLKKLIQRKYENLFLLILDNVTDPHNLGACIRSAEAAGVDALIIPKNRAAGLSATVRKVACGAAEILPIVSVTNLAQCLKMLQESGIWIYGAAGEASASIYQTSLTGNIAMVMGSEGDGLRRLTREHCDTLVHIPMTGATASLNVSVATGICLFEAMRQRQHHTE